MTNSKDVATAWMTSQVNGDAEGFLGRLSDDVMWTIQGTTRFSGRRAKPEMLKLIAEELAPVMSGTLVLDEVIGDGERAVVMASMKGKGPTGPYDQKYCFVLRISGEKITEIVEYCDTVMIETAVCGRKLVAA